MKVVYFKNSHYDKSNNIAYVNIYIYILIKNMVKLDYMNSIQSQY
jgi:hypothetical protein